MTTDTFTQIQQLTQLRAGVKALRLALKGIAAEGDEGGDAGELLPLVEQLVELVSETAGGAFSEIVAELEHRELMDLVHQPAARRLPALAPKGGPGGKA